MKIIKRNIVDRSSEIGEIKSFLNANFSTIFHEPEFNQIVEKNFRTRCYYLCAYNDNGKLVALCPCHSKKNGFTIFTQSNPTKFEIPYGGWVYDREETRIKELMSAMQPAANEGIVYWSMPQIEHDDYSEMEKKNRFQTAVIDLDQSEDDIWNNSINSKRRNMIRKAEKNKVTVEMIDHARFGEYYNMMIETYGAAELMLKPIEYYVNVLKTYIGANKASVFLAKVGANFVSGLVALRNKFACHYWLGASRKNVDNLGQGELLQWAAIKWAKENRSRFYDLCVLEPERLPNIARFKSGFSDRVVPFYCISKKGAGYRLLNRLAGDR
ncbi:MAG TPA: GNAT family N-acetyltransferase [bacterium]